MLAGVPLVAGRPLMAPAGAAFRAGEFVSPEEVTVSSSDLGLFNCDAVYDVVSVRQSRFFMLDEHLDRFQHSARAWHLEIPYERDEIKAILARLVERAGLEDAYVKLQLTRGRSPDGSRDPRRSEQVFIAFAIPYHWLWGEWRSRQGGTVHVSSIERISTRAIDTKVKNFCRADFVQAQFEAFERGHDDAVLLGPDGSVTEGIGWNILVVQDGSVRTPQGNVLGGITRLAVREICADEGIPFALEDFDRAALDEVDEIFVSSTAGGVLPVLRIGERTMGEAAGPVTGRLQEQYWSRRDAGWHGTRVAELLQLAAP